MDEIIWLALTLVVLLVGVFALGACFGPVIGDWLDERRQRRARAKRLQTISGREVAKMARMRQEMRDEVAAQRAKRGRK